MGRSENDARDIRVNESGGIGYAIPSSRRHLRALSNSGQRGLWSGAQSPWSKYARPVACERHWPDTTGHRRMPWRWANPPAVRPVLVFPAGSSFPGPPIGGMKSVRFLGLFEAIFHKIAHVFTETSGFRPPCAQAAPILTAFTPIDHPANPHPKHWTAERFCDNLR